MFCCVPVPPHCGQVRVTGWTGSTGYFARCLCGFARFALPACASSLPAGYCRGQPARAWVANPPGVWPTG